MMKEREVRTIEGKWYFLGILPYLPAKNMIDGLVLHVSGHYTVERSGERGTTSYGILGTHH